MGQEAKQNGILMRKIASAYSPENICDEREAYLPAVFLTAQVRSVISFFAAADKYSGGKAVEHFISAALEFKRGDKLDGNGLIIGKTDKKAVSHGQVVTIRAEKNKLSAPNTTCSFNYYFKKSDSIPVGFIDYYDELTTIAIENGIIAQGGGGNYTFGEEKVRGKEALVQRIKEDPEFIKAIYERVKNI
jgi:hypothetical protein